MPSVWILTGLLLLAMATRVSADWMPSIRMTHYGYAALSWLVGVAVWAWKILPFVREVDEE